MDAALHEALSACLTDAIDRANIHAFVAEYPSVEGNFLLVTTGDNTPLLLASVVDINDSPFNEQARDRARNVGARLHAPYLLVTSLRSTVLYATDAVTKRQAPERQVLMRVKGAEVNTLEDALVAANRVAITEALRQTILAAQDGRFVERRPEEFFVDRVTGTLEEILSCTKKNEATVNAAERLGLSVVGYALLQQRSPDLDELSVPSTSTSGSLLLDIISAFLREAGRRGHTFFPDGVTDIDFKASQEHLFASSVKDLVHTAKEIDLSRFSDEQKRSVVDAMLMWCSGTRHIPVPTIDAMDLALAAGRVLDMPHSSTPRILEAGSSMGLVGIRTRLAIPGATANVYASSDLEERSMLLRAAGQLDDQDDLKVISREDLTGEPFDVVAFTFTTPDTVDQLSDLIDEVEMSADAVCLMFVPMSLLRNEQHGELRQQLASKLDIQWVLTSGADPLAEPDEGICCIVARPLGNEVSTTNFAFIRTRFEQLIPPAASIRDLSLERVERFRVFLRYLVTSRHGKMNAEVVVRRIDRGALLYRSSLKGAGWDDLLIPPDVIASILRKLSHKLRPLDSMADVSGGIRTGANDTFAPELTDIVDRQIEDVYWQRNDSKGEAIDNVILTSLDEVSSIAGIPDAERRLLLLPEDRNELKGTNADSLLKQAEKGKIHKRPSVRNRDPWWYLGEPPTPHAIIPKQQRHRWLVIDNVSKAFVTDAFIGVRFNEPDRLTNLSEKVVLWMNSSLGLFMSELVQREAHVADVTVRDAHEFPIPEDAVLDQIDVRRHRDFLYRPVRSIAEEFGSENADAVRPDTIARDRRRLDKFFMNDVFELTSEEQEWVYRFALAWRSTPSNVRHLANALAAEIMLSNKLRPLREWYSVRIEQLPDDASRTIVLPPGVDRAEAAQSMFNHQVTFYQGKTQDDVMECGSAEEAELVELLVNLGKRSIDVPTDLPLVNEVLPLIKSFAKDLDKAIKERSKVIPKDLRKNVASDIRTVFTS